MQTGNVNTVLYGADVNIADQTVDTWIISYARLTFVMSDIASEILWRTFVSPYIWLGKQASLCSDHELKEDKT